MRDYGKADSPYWVDSNGAVMRTPSGKKLHFPKIPLHAALRAFVYIRDGFACRGCGIKPDAIPLEYTGRETLDVPKKAKSGYFVCLVIDHIRSRRNGGTNHPSNLQTLCYCCNASKSGLVDSKVGK